MNNSAKKSHKDSVFTFLFSEPDILRELYSAIEGIPLPQDIPIDINTLSDVLFRTQRNDISFTINDRLIVLIEHQSTINNNIPLRFLMYIGRLYEKITDHKKRFQEKLEKIPRPEFIVLYNGKDPYPDHKELRLSDAFKNFEGLKTNIPLELSVQVYNINKGHSQEILSKSSTLKDYSFFIEKIREYEKENNTLDEALISGIKYCIENDILKDFLRKHGSEVINMLYAEYSFEEEAEVIREEFLERGLERGLEKGREEGLERGLEKGREEGLEEGREESRQYFLNLLNQGLTIEEIKQYLNQGKDTFK